MPVYEYKCSKCGCTTTVIRKINEAERKPICVNDAQETLRVYDAAPAIQFKGGGWAGKEK